MSLKLITHDIRFTWTISENEYDQYWDEELKKSITEITGNYTSSKCKVVNGYTNNSTCGYHGGSFLNIMSGVKMVDMLGVVEDKRCQCRRRIILNLPTKIEEYLFSKNIDPQKQFSHIRPIWYTSKDSKGKVYKVVFDLKGAMKMVLYHTYLHKLGFVLGKAVYVKFDDGVVIITDYAGRCFTEEDMTIYYDVIVERLKKYSIDPKMVDWNEENFCIDENDKIWLIDFESWTLNL